RLLLDFLFHFFFSSRRRHTRSKRDWSSDVCSSDLIGYDVFLKYLSVDTLAVLWFPQLIQSDRTRVAAFHQYHFHHLLLALELDKQLGMQLFHLLLAY